MHGWPELSISWRHQLPCFAALGFRAVAPDMRGYGRSSVYPRHEDYALEQIVRDMLELLDALGRDKAVWVGHDWGSPVVWNLASHHPERCFGVANLCVPYFAKGFAPETMLPLVDRSVYPEAEYPAGQWDYQLFYEESFDKASAAFEANVREHREGAVPQGQSARQGQAVAHGGRAPRRRLVRRRRPGARRADGHRRADREGLRDVRRPLSSRNGFFGPDSWYMNRERNLDFASRAKNGGLLTMPVLFLHGEYDYTCETVTSRLAEPMRQDCKNLTEVIVASRTLDGAGKARRGERGPREMAGGPVSRVVARVRCAT